MEIDFEAYEKYLDARKNKKAFVTVDNIIKKSDVEKIHGLFKKYGKVIASECIKNGHSKDDAQKKFEVEVSCKVCGNVVIKYFSRQRLIEYIQNSNYLCQNCMKAKMLKESEAGRIEEQRYKEIKERNTEIYIESYLNPSSHWIPDTPKYERYKTIFHSYVDNAKVKIHILQMKYRDFLETPYWKTVAEHKKYKAGYRCELCNSTGSLNVHHKTYEHHGDEINNLNDLVVLCKSCHEKFHDISQTDN
jgi:hypothetical protein